MRATLLLSLALSACQPPSFETDSGQLAISDEEVVDIEAEDGGPSPFLAGTELCPTIDCTADGCPEDESDLLPCFDQSFTGPVSVGECLSFTEAGVVDWTFTAQACPANDVGYVPTDDHVAIDVVDASEVEAHLAMPLEDLVEAAEGTTSVRVERPEDWRYADGDTWQLAAGEPFILTPRLRTIADQVPVAWRDGAVDGGDGVDVSNGEGPGRARVVLDEEQSAEFGLGVGGTTFALGEARGVPVSSIKSLEIAVVYVLDEEAGTSQPYAARAVARDADGKLVLGAPVEWRIAGLLVGGGPDGSMPGADYASFADVCADPGTTYGPQTARLTASVGHLSASTELSWTPRLEADPLDGWEANEACQKACGCDSGRPGAMGGAGVLLAAALLRRRSSK